MSKVQLAKHSTAAKSDSILANMWAEQVSTKTVQTETNTRGLKRKLCIPEGGVPKAGRMDTLCVCPCVCPAEMVVGKDNTEGDQYIEMLSQPEPLSMSIGPPEEREGGGMNNTVEGEQHEEMRSQDEHMSCGPDRSYNEGDEAGQGEPLSLSPPQSSGRGSEGSNNMVCGKPPAASNTDQEGEMDEQMSCGPDRSYSEGEETGQGEPMSQSPTRSSGRGSEGKNSLFWCAPPVAAILDQGGDMNITGV